ncbi:hypothetical protein [Pseudomonas sp. RIT411]|uniref:hypothetical protein n=1 Tax=Pseudomonas sp. RIT411 TaxID=2202160 RepID=UPI000D3B2B95|nr:hypothetical protein [Pseudomonas sp. RIT 411]RAU39246.1 hypothetical protein DBY63_012260 [Pseudomonas sp. RIT 411]
MPEGIQVFDESGNIVLDTNDRLTRYLGFHQPTTPNGAIDIPQFGDPGNRRPWYTLLRIGAPEIGNLALYENPTIIIQGSTLTWYSRGTAGGDARHCLIIWGDF